jgi:hypothetical protein
MTFTALIIVCALLGSLFFFASVRRLRRRRVVGGMAHGATALILFLLAACAALIGSNLKSYQRLSFEQPACEVQLSRIGERQFNAALSYPDGKRESFALRGDEWMLDARVLKWHAFANLLGFDTAYRLERISGRYTRAVDETTEPHTAFDLNPPGRIDPFQLVKHYHSWVPWMDALYGNSTYVPMADGALYEIKVSQSGLIARPLNQAAREAVGGWHQ